MLGSASTDILSMGWRWQAMPKQISRRESWLAAAGATAAAAEQSSGEMPVVGFGPHSVSRLIVGGNPVSGNSHVSGELSREMADYFTAANIKKLLRECELAGINTWQSRGDKHIMRLLREYRLEGGRIQWIGQTASEFASVSRNIAEMASYGPIGIYHHGSRTDSLWNAGSIDQVRDALKAIRQSGKQVGLGTHIPEVIDYVESKDWDVDFYMTCLYNLGRTQAQAEQIAGRKMEGELFWDADRERMLDRVRRTTKQCLIFKVYGASRHCGSLAQMRAALALACRSAKPGDAFVIGMFPKHKEQVKENCRLLSDALRAARSS
jgi:hypothetical protein